MKQNGYVWGAVIGALIIIVVAFVIHSRAVAPTASNQNATSTQSSTGTTTVDLGNGRSITLPPGAKLEVIKSGPSAAVSQPSLAGDIKIDASLSPDVQSVLRTKEEDLISQLKQSPDRADLWLKLGVYRKIAGDYIGAAEAWNFVATNQSSLSYIAYGNLGDLYMNFLKNYPKAEANYKAAIALQPTFIDYYRDLFTLYTSFYKTNTSAAADIVAQGLTANPNNPDLLQLQKQLKAR